MLRGGDVELLQCLCGDGPHMLRAIEMDGVCVCVHVYIYVFIYVYRCVHTHEHIYSTMIVW